MRWSNIKNWVCDDVESVVAIIFITVVVPLMIYFANKEQEYQEAHMRYEITVVDKYECLGSNYHLIGGRATETEYHIIYKVTPLTDEAKKYGRTRQEDYEVNYITYRRVNIGARFIGSKEYLWSYL